MEMMHPFYRNHELFEDLMCYVREDDKEKFLEHLLCYPYHLSSPLVGYVAAHKAKKCLIAMIEGEVGITAFELYAEEVVKYPAYQYHTPLASVARFFPTALDVIDMLLKRGPPEHVNIKCDVINIVGTPLEQLLVSLSLKPHLYPWMPGYSLFKLVLLLCLPKTKPYLDSARLIASYTDEINSIAWTLVSNGRLAAFAALLLVAGDKVTGSSIRQNITNMIEALDTQSDLDHDEASYQSVLVETIKLLDIFERAGDTLSLHCSSMRQNVAADKALTNVSGLLKKAGFVLQPRDLDLRECYRGHLELCNASLFKLSDSSSLNNQSLSSSSHTWGRGLGATRKYPYIGHCHFLHQLRSGTQLNLAPSSSMQRLFTTAAGQIKNGASSVSFKQFLLTALMFRRGIRF